MYKVFLIFLILSSFNVHSQTTGTICDNCSYRTAESKARYASNQLYQNNGTVFVLDFAQGQLYKFMVYRSDGNEQPQSIGSAFDEINGLSEALHDSGYNEDQVLSIQYFSDNNLSWESNDSNTLNSQQIVLMMLIPTQNDIDLFTDFRDFHEVMKTNPEVNLSGLGYDSAYDVVGNHAAGVQIGNYVENNYPWGYFFRSSLQSVTTHFSIPGVNTYSYSVTITFSDGSTMLMKLQNGVLKPVEGEFYDSENNRIPERTRDIDGQTYMFDDYYSQNVINFMNRMQSLGVPIYYEGDQQNRYECRFECRAFDSQERCRLSCSRK